MGWLFDSMTVLRCGHHEASSTCRSLAIRLSLWWASRCGRYPRLGSRGRSWRRLWLSRTSRRLVSTKILVAHCFPLVAAQCVTGGNITRLHVILAAEHGLNLKLEVELEVVQGIDFSCQAQDALDPRVAGLEHLGLLAVLQNTVDERQDGNHSALLVSLVQQALQVQVLVADDLVLFDGEMTQPVAQVLQQRPLTSLQMPPTTS